MQRAVQRLVQEGLVITRPGTGNFVAARRAMSRPDFSWQTTTLGPSRNNPSAISAAMTQTTPGIIPLHSGYPSEDLLPIALVRSALARASRGAAVTDRPAMEGLPELRAWFASEVAASPGSPGAAPSADDVIIVPGSQSALASIFRALAQPGDSIVMESPTYWGAIAAARQAGLVIVPIARGAGAPSADALDAALVTSGARLFYAQPNFANPTGAIWSRAESDAILGVIRSRDAFVIEDDWAHDFGIDEVARPLVAHDADGHVVYIRSLTKSLSSAVRVGAIIARGPALARIQVDRTVTDLYVSGTLQAAALEVMTSPGWRAHARRLQSALRERRDTLARAVVAELGAETLTALPRGGINLWLRFDDRVDVADLARRSLAAGVAIAPGTDWFPTEPPGAYARLNYSGPRPDRFGEAIHILAELLGR